MSGPGILPNTPWAKISGVTDALSCVNLCLASVGAEPVTSLELDGENDPGSDVTIAFQWLDKFDLDVQSRGWSWNSDEKLTVTPTIVAPATTGTIALPALTLQVNAAYWADTGAPALVAQRGQQLYDQIGHTFQFSCPLQIDLVYRLDFLSLPQPARALIASLAVHSFQASKQGAQIVMRVTEEDMQRAWAALEQFEDRARPANQVAGNISVMRNLYGSGVRRNRGAF